MKATGFSVGDMVLIDGKLTKIDAVHLRKVGWHSRKDKLAWTRIGLVQPIPLASDLLERHGFGRVPQPGCSNPYYWKLEKRDEDGELLYRIEAYNTPFRGMFIQINNLSDCESISFCKQIEHVHELQHALRLCGIDTEIIIKED